MCERRFYSVELFCPFIFFGISLEWFLFRTYYGNLFTNCILTERKRDQGEQAD